MQATTSPQAANQHNLATRALAGVCHNCEICPWAARKPDSTFNKLMIWHSTWCPARIAHNKVYGAKQLP